MDPKTNLLTNEYTQDITKFMVLSQRQSGVATTGKLKCLYSTC